MQPILGGAACYRGLQHIYDYGDDDCDDNDDREDDDDDNDG